MRRLDVQACYERITGYGPFEYGMGVLFPQRQEIKVTNTITTRDLSVVRSTKSEIQCYSNPPILAGIDLEGLPLEEAIQKMVGLEPLKNYSGE